MSTVGDWGTLGEQPGQDVTRDQGVALPDLVQKTPQGAPFMPADSIQQLEAQGYWKCPGKLKSGQPCDFWLDPQQKSQIEHSSGYFTCPKCHQSFNLMDELPWHGVNDPQGMFEEGGATHIGIPMTDQGQIGENVVAGLGTIPGYGPITWWHPGGARSQSPLDGATSEWGIEVKTLSYDAKHHRFAPGGEAGPQYIEDKNAAAQEMGLKGILGILVLLDYRRDVADVYAKEMPLDGWQDSQGRWHQGVKQFRKNTAQKLLTEVPFESPYKDPNNPTPVSYSADNYYKPPQPLSPPQSPETTPF